MFDCEIGDCKFISGSARGLSIHIGRSHKIENLRSQSTSPKDKEVELEVDERVEELEATGEVVIEEKKEDGEDNDEMVKSCILLYDRGNKTAFGKFYHRMGATLKRRVWDYIQVEEERKKRVLEG